MREVSCFFVCFFLLCKPGLGSSAVARPTSLSVKRKKKLEGSGMDAGPRKGQPKLLKTGENQEITTGQKELKGCWAHVRCLVRCSPEWSRLGSFEINFGEYESLSRKCDKSWQQDSKFTPTLEGLTLLRADRH